MREEGQCSSLENLVLDPELPCTTLTYLGNHPAPHFLQLEIKAIKLDESSSLPSLPLSWHLKLKFECGKSVQFSSVQSLSRVRLPATPWIAARQASLFITISRSSLRLTSIKFVMPSSHLILGRPLLLLPPIPPSIRVFSSESTLRMRWNQSNQESQYIIVIIKASNSCVILSLPTQSAHF